MAERGWAEIEADAEQGMFYFNDMPVVVSEARRLRKTLKSIAGYCLHYQGGSEYTTYKVKSCRGSDKPQSMFCSPCKASHALGLPIND